jgi:hypothetical protein
MITVPSILFGLVVALLAGALFHALRGGSGWRLLLNFGLSTFGFALSQLVGMQFGLTLYQFGALDLGLGIVGSALFLITGIWLVKR